MRQLGRFGIFIDISGQWIQSCLAEARDFENPALLTEPGVQIVEYTPFTPAFHRADGLLCSLLSPKWACTKIAIPARRPIPVCDGPSKSFRHICQCCCSACRIAFLGAICPPHLFHHHVASTRPVSQIFNSPPRCALRNPILVILAIGRAVVLRDAHWNLGKLLAVSLT